MTTHAFGRQPIERGSAQAGERQAGTRVSSWLPLLAASVLLPCGPAAIAQSEPSAGDSHAHHHRLLQSAPETLPGPVEIDIPDTELVTQNGTTVRLASDLVRDRIVVMDFVYTTCTTICPVLSAIFGQVQARLGDRLGSDVVMISISVDPVRDTPARLKAYSDKHGALDGWTWLTGSKPVVDETLRELGAYTPNFEDHPSMVLIGDGRTGEWVRLLGFPGVDQIVAKVDELSAAGAIAASTGSSQEDR